MASGAGIGLGYIWLAFYYLCDSSIFLSILTPITLCTIMKGLYEQNYIKTEKYILFFIAIYNLYIHVISNNELVFARIFSWSLICIFIVLLPLAIISFKNNKQKTT